jgi:uroporphyrinogen decarboxylase
LLADRLILGMDKRQRVMAALRGQPVDRVPVAAWGHDYVREWSAQGLAEATLEAYQRYDWDFIKLNPRATYYAEAWGARYEPHPAGEEGPRLVEPVIRRPEELAGISPVDPSGGPFGQQLDALAMVVRAVDGEAPVIQTVFSPLAVLSQLAGGIEETKRLMAAAPTAVEDALQAIAITLAQYAQLCLEAGADGIFLATLAWGSRRHISPVEYAQWARPYDLTVLAAVAHAPFNVLHVCRDHNLLAWLLDYPVACFHWAAHDPSNPSLAEVLARTGRAVSGGVAQDGSLLQGPPQRVQEEARQAIAATGGRRFLLAPGCSISPKTPAENLLALRRAAEVMT